MLVLCFPFCFTSYSPLWVIYIRHDEKLVTLAILFGLRPIGGILPSVWARQQHTSVNAESCYLAFLFDLHPVGGILSSVWARQ